MSEAEEHFAADLAVRERAGRAQALPAVKTDSAGHASWDHAQAG